VDAYLRLNMPMEKETLAVTDWSHLEDIEALTNAFLKTQVVSATLVQSSKLAISRSKCCSLGQSGECGHIDTVTVTGC